MSAELHKNLTDFHKSWKQDGLRPCVGSCGSGLEPVGCYGKSCWFDSLGLRAKVSLGKILNPRTAPDVSPGRHLAWQPLPSLYECGVLDKGADPGRFSSLSLTL